MTTTLRFPIVMAGATVLILAAAAALAVRDWVSTMPGASQPIAVRPSAPAAPATTSLPEAGVPAPQPGADPGQDAGAASTPRPPAAGGQAAAGRAAVSIRLVEEGQVDRPATHQRGDRAHDGSASRSGGGHGRWVAELPRPPKTKR